MFEFRITSESNETRRLCKQCDEEKYLYTTVREFARFISIWENISLEIRNLLMHARDDGNRGMLIAREFLKNFECLFPIKFILKINSFQVYSGDTQYHRTIEGRTSSRINMRLQLQSSNFGGGNSIMHGNGQLVLRCTAQIGSFYQEYTEKELGIPQKDPIPARGACVG